MNEQRKSDLKNRIAALNAELTPALAKVTAAGLGYVLKGTF